MGSGVSEAAGMGRRSVARGEQPNAERGAGGIPLRVSPRPKEMEMTEGHGNHGGVKGMEAWHRPGAGGRRRATDEREGREKAT